MIDFVYFVGCFFLLWVVFIREFKFRLRLFNLLILFYVGNKFGMFIV